MLVQFIATHQYWHYISQLLQVEGLLSLVTLTVLILLTFKVVCKLTLSSSYSRILIFEDCFWLLDALLKYAVEGVVPQYVTVSSTSLPPAFLPKRMEGWLY